jgi:hypothetical protein
MSHCRQTHTMPPAHIPTLLMLEVCSLNTSHPRVYAFVSVHNSVTSSNACISLFLLFPCSLVSQRTPSCIVESHCMYACMRLSVDQPDIPICVEHIADATLTQHTHTQEDVHPTTAATTAAAVAASAFVPPSIDLDVDSLIT